MVLRILVIVASSTISLTACAGMPLFERHPLRADHLDYFEPADASASDRATLVLLMSGCGGLIGADGPKAIMNDYAQLAQQAGAHAVVIDSLGARDIDFDDARSQVCTGLRLRGRERAEDLVVARTLASEHWGRTFDTVIAAGWSHGGWAVMEQLRIDARGDAPALNPDAAVLVYPYCGRFNSSRRAAWDFDGPLLHLSAENDVLSPTETCREIIVRARDGAEGVETVVFDGVTHAFDEADQTPHSRYIYDAEKSAEAHTHFSRFIAEITGGEASGR